MPDRGAGGRPAAGPGDAGAHSPILGDLSGTTELRAFMPQIQELEVTSPTGVDVRLRLAGPGARGYAFSIDYGIRLVAAVAWFVAATALWPDQPALRHGGDTATVEVLHVMVSVLIPLGIFFLYHPVLEALGSGRTPGKRLAGVELVDLQGQAPTVTAILIRNVFRLVDSLPFAYGVGVVACLSGRMAQRLGDMAAGTVLVYAAGQVDAAAFDDRALAASARPEIAIARDLLGRWGQLDAGHRRTLATRLLGTRLAADPSPSDAELEAALAALVDGR